MTRKPLVALFVVVSLLFFQATDCGMDGGKIYVYHPSFSSQGTKLYVVIRAANYDPIAGCYFDYDKNPDTARIRCSIDSSGFSVAIVDTTVVFVDSAEVALDGKDGICYFLDAQFPEINDVLEYGYTYISDTTADTFKLAGSFHYFDSEEKWCNYDGESYYVELRLHVRSDSPYVWVRPVGYNAVFVSPETTAYLIDDSFPFVEQDSFRLTHRRIVRFHIGEYYHYGAVELIPGGDSGWARLRVSFSVVPRLGWTLPPADTTLRR